MANTSGNRPLERDHRGSRRWLLVSGFMFAFVAGQLAGENIGAVVVAYIGGVLLGGWTCEE